MNGLFGSSISQYTDAFDVRYTELKQLINGRQGPIGEGEMSADKVQFYTNMLAVLQTRLNSISESAELCSPIVGKTVMELKKYSQFNDWLTEEGVGLAWEIFGYYAHNLMTVNNQDNIAGFASPFAARERHPNWGSFFGKNPLRAYSLEALEERFNEDLHNKEPAKKPRNSDYWLKFLEDVNSALEPMVNTKLCYPPYQLADMLLKLKQVPELADPLKKCHIASLIVFVNFAEQESKRLAEEKRAGAQVSNVSAKHAPDITQSPSNQSDRRSSIGFGIRSSLDKKVEKLGMLLERLSKQQPEALDEFKEQIKTDLSKLTTTIQQQLSTYEQLPKELEQKLRQLDELTQQFQSSILSNNGSAKQEDFSIEPIKLLIAEALDEASTNQNAILERFGAQEHALKAIQEGFDDLKRTIQNDKPNPLLERVEVLEGAVKNLVNPPPADQIVVDPYERRLTSIETALGLLTTEIQKLNQAPVQYGHDDLGFVEEDPVLTKLGTLENLLKSLSDRLSSPRRPSSQASYSGLQERQHLVNDGRGQRAPVDDSCCNIL